VTRLGGDQILVLIHVSIWIQDWILGFLPLSDRAKSLSTGLEKNLRTDLAEILWKVRFGPVYS